MPRYRGSYSMPSCSEYAFETDVSRIDIAFAAIFFIATFVLLWVASSRIGRCKKQGQRVAGATLLLISILFAWFTHIVRLIYIPIVECDIFNYQNIYQAPLLSSWLVGISEYLLLAAILTSLTHKLQKDFGLIQPAILKTQKFWAVLMILVLLTALGLNTAYNHYLYNDVYGSYYSDDPYLLVSPMRGVLTTYYVIAAAGMILAAATIGKTLSQAPGGLRSKALTMSTTILLAAALGLTLTNMGSYIDNTYMMLNKVVSYGSSAYKSYVARIEAANFLGSFFYCLAFWAAVQVGSYSVNPASAPPAYAPPPPQQPMVFTTGNEGYQSGYSRDMGAAGAAEQGYGRNPEYVR
ncbi:hypothetical protein BDW74DRAFT_88538 [Aspergillus multicolor]|uniref:uncharacterized protein n=1 Tax=Aspergillus multicolor TaxID=41759 RepID=UPI003CCCB513